MIKLLFTISCLWAAAAVGLGAFGAHALKDYLPKIHPHDRVEQMSDQWETGARYHLIHALAAVISCIAAAVISSAKPEINPGQIRLFLIPTVLFLLGSLIFAGCLYAMVLGGPRFLGAVVPIGGALMIIAWLTLAFAGWRSF